MIFKRISFFPYLFPKSRKSRCKTLLYNFPALQQLSFLSIYSGPYILSPQLTHMLFHPCRCCLRVFRFHNGGNDRHTCHLTAFEDVHISIIQASDRHRRNPVHSGKISFSVSTEVRIVTTFVVVGKIAPTPR